MGAPRRNFLSNMTKEDWLTRTRLDNVRAAIIADEYAGVYPYLLKHFESMPAPLGATEAVAGLHVVYGWMPTIAKPGHSLRVLGGQEKKLLRILNAARTPCSPGLNVNDAALLKQFTNNSIVGGSKLLHFLNPRV